MCCSSGSFVSQGLFRNFCLRFASDFDSTAEEWVFAEEDIINTCMKLLVTFCWCIGRFNAVLVNMFANS